MKTVLMAILGIFCSSALVNEKPPLETVSKVDLSRYAGLWYEIARLPNRFQKECLESTAEYTMLEDGKIRVVNSCREKDGKERSVEGIAWVEDPVSNAKLSVSFVPSWLRWTGIGKGDYWIIDLSPDYQWVVVSEPKRLYLWILARNPKLDPAVFHAITKKLQERRFDLSTLIIRRK